MLSDSNFSLIHIILTTHTLNPIPIISEILQFIGNQLPCLVLQKMIWEFPGGLVVRTWRFHCGEPGSIPGRELRSFKLCGRR